MARRLNRLCVIALSAGTIAAAAYGPPSSAAPSSSTERFSFVVATTHWTVRGHVAGLPGNAHSGVLVFDTSEPEMGGRALDWSCPADVTPPLDYAIGGESATSCTIVRYRSFGTAESSSNRPTFSGPLRATIREPFDFTTIDTSTAAPTSEALRPVDVTFTRVGPVSSTTETSTSNGYRTRTVTLTAPMRLSGQVDGIRFADPRVRQTVDSYQRETTWTTPVG